MTLIIGWVVRLKAEVGAVKRSGALAVWHDNSWLLLCIVTAKCTFDGIDFR